VLSIEQNQDAVFHPLRLKETAMTGHGAPHEPGAEDEAAPHESGMESGIASDGREQKPSLH
jgi:hypothetical protein